MIEAAFDKAEAQYFRGDEVDRGLDLVEGCLFRLEQLPMVATDDAPLKQRPDVLHRIGVNVAPSSFFVPVLDRFVPGVAVRDPLVIPFRAIDVTTPPQPPPTRSNR